MNFMHYRKLFFAISLSVLLPGLLSLMLFGLKPAIDFTGGAVLELAVLESSEALAADLAELHDFASVELSDDTLLLTATQMDNQAKDALMMELAARGQLVEEVRFETVGPVLGRELIQKTILAVILVAGVITFYVWRQFSELKYGICAILAMLHDSLILLGIFSLLGYLWGIEVDLLFVTALLTTMSFSIHDTIVVYDRLRELKRKNTQVPFEQLANAAVVETLSRSLNNSITIIVMLLSLVVLGGDSIRYFALALLIGAVVGTYSSTFTAVPLLVEVKLKEDKIKN